MHPSLLTFNERTKTRTVPEVLEWSMQNLTSEDSSLACEISKTLKFLLKKGEGFFLFQNLEQRKEVLRIAEISQDIGLFLRLRTITKEEEELFERVCEAKVNIEWWEALELYSRKELSFDVTGKTKKAFIKLVREMGECGLVELFKFCEKEIFERFDQETKDEINKALLQVIKKHNQAMAIESICKVAYDESIDLGALDKIVVIQFAAALQQQRQTLHLAALLNRKDIDDQTRKIIEFIAIRDIDDIVENRPNIDRHLLSFLEMWIYQGKLKVSDTLKARIRRSLRLIYIRKQQKSLLKAPRFKGKRLTDKPTIRKIRCIG